MKYHDLDQMFSAARNVELETSATEIASWVGTAAVTSTGVLGVAAKLKLIIAKKTFMLLGITLGSTGAIVLTTALLSPSSPEKENTPIIVTELMDQEKSNSDKDYIVELDDTTETPEVAPLPPAPPVAPIAPFAPMAPISGREFTFVAPPHPVMPELRATLGNAPMVVVNTRAPRPPRVPKIASHHHSRACANACTDDDKKKKTVEGDGNVIKQDRDISPFSSIAISGLFDVYISQGTEEKVTVETDANLQEYVETVNDGSTLYLRNGKAKFKKITKMKVYVVVKDINKIRTRGIGDLIGETELKASKLSLYVESVGDVELELACDQLDIKHEGVGDLKLKGTSKQTSVRSKAVGDLKAYDLDVTNMDIEHSGVGDASIHVSNNLSIDFKGVGTVNYKGEPKQKNIKKSGVGSVKDKS